MMRFHMRFILFIVMFFLMTALIMKAIDTQPSELPAFANVHNVRREIVDVQVEVGQEAPANVTRFRQEYVRQMMRHAWSGYREFAWGHNELRPLTHKRHSGSVFGAAPLGATIVDALDTLLIMELDEEFQEARLWVEHHFDITQANYEVSVFETTIRFVGGLLACYALTGDALFRNKAAAVADAILPAFNSPTGLPYPAVNPATGAVAERLAVLRVVSHKGGPSRDPTPTSSRRPGQLALSEVGTLHMEFTYLSDITGNNVYRKKVDNVRKFFYEAGKRDGFYYNHINTKNGKWGSSTLSMGALGDSFYEYLLKSWLQSNLEDEQGRIMFDDAMQPLLKALVRLSNGGLTYLGHVKETRFDAKMEHLACFSGGLLALASYTLDNLYAEYYMDLGKKLTQTCRESYDRATSKLGPEVFRFDKGMEARSPDATKYYILRPETVESYFILYRLTKDPKYREWGWDMVQALERHTRVEAGYSGIKDVYSSNPPKDDVQQSFFLAETLKYLYLLFSDESVLSLDKWVFNTEAHPLPIKDVNPFYEKHNKNYLEDIGSQNGKNESRLT